jgi:hypothetical protein
VQFEKRDSALSQAQVAVDLLKALGITQNADYKVVLTEILSEVFPQIGAEANNWNIDVTVDEEGGGPGAF